LAELENHHRKITPKPKEDAVVEIRKSVRCPDCGKSYEANLTAETVVCPHCSHRLSRIDQVSQLLEEWYYPRRWIRAVERPRARFLIERLWQQQFEPQNLYQSLSPSETNFEVFCYNVTGVVIKGVEDGWARLDFPEDPMAEDPVYRLEIKDLERFSSEMEKAMPDVKWDEDIEIVATAPEPAPADAPAEPDVAS
jgi:endogenous inhibitor of DNA gyrase (YacG/DUF329 family)